MDAEENLKIALEALRRIRAGDSGPAYWIAKGALEEIEESPKKFKMIFDPFAEEGK